MLSCIHHAYNISKTICKKSNMVFVYELYQIECSYVITAVHAVNAVITQHTRYSFNTVINLLAGNLSVHGDTVGIKR